MPQVPIYQPQANTRPVGTPYSDVRATPDDYGASAAQGLSNLGNEVTKVATEDQKKADDLRAMTADLEFAEVASDQRREFKLKQGVNAFDTAPVYDVLAKAQARISDGLGNDRQRQQFLLRARQRTDQTRDDIETHSGQQHQVAFGQMADGQSAQALSDVADNYNKPELVSAAIQKVLVGPPDADGNPTLGPLPFYLKTVQGMPADKADQVEAQFKADAYGKAVQGYLARGDGVGALSYFESIKGELGNKADELRKHIESVRKDQVGEMQAASSFSSAIDPKAPLEERAWRVDAQKARAEVDALPASPAKDEAVQRLEHRLNVADKLKKEAVVSVFNRALSAYEKSGSLTTVAPADKTWLQDENHDPMAWEKLKNIAKADAAHARGMASTPAEDEALGRFEVWAADNPDKAGTMTIEQFNSDWAPQFSKKGREAGAKMVAGRHDAANKEKLGSDVTAAILNAGGNEGGAGLLPTNEKDRNKWPPAAMAFLAKAKTKLDDMAAREKKATGKEVTPEQINQWAADLFVKMKVPGTGHNFLGIPGLHYGDKFTTPIQEDMNSGSQVPRTGVNSVDLGAPVLVKTEADYAKLPSGAEYIDPNGKRRRKK